MPQKLNKAFKNAEKRMLLSLVILLTLGAVLGVSDLRGAFTILSVTLGAVVGVVVHRILIKREYNK